MSLATTSFTWRHTNTCKKHGFNAVVDDSGQVSSATTSFQWRDTNIYKNHGYNPVADDPGQLLSATKWRHTNTRKNHGYIAMAEVSCAGSHDVPRILHSFPTKKVKNVEKIQTFSDHSYTTVSSRPRERCVQSLVQIGSEMLICIRYKQTNKNEQKTILASYIKLSLRHVSATVPRKELWLKRVGPIILIKEMYHTLLCFKYTGVYSHWWRQMVVETRSRKSRIVHLCVLYVHILVAQKENWIINSKVCGQKFGYNLNIYSTLCLFVSHKEAANSTARWSFVFPTNLTINNDLFLIEDLPFIS
jgi:hypothetical protein